MYDLGRDPDEGANLVDRSTGEPRAASDAALRSELGERLAALMAANGTAAPPQAGVGSALSRSR
jgi:hypothetical protein